MKRSLSETALLAHNFGATRKLVIQVSGYSSPFESRRHLTGTRGWNENETLCPEIASKGFQP